MATRNEITSHEIPYTGKDKYTVICDSSAGQVVAHVERNEKRATPDKAFATKPGAIDYWFDQYYRGNIYARDLR